MIGIFQKKEEQDNLKRMADLALKLKNEGL